MMIDPDGCLYGDFMDEKGRLIGHDGIDDGKLYVIKTTEKSFGDREDGSFVPAAGLSSREQKATRDFIIENSGNTETFKNNDIAYRNSVEIEGNAQNRQFMVAGVSRDNGRGGTRPDNNREYGGYQDGKSWKTAEPGEVADPSQASTVSIMLPTGVSTYHSHPSGTAQHGDTPTASFFYQHPSQLDMQTAGNTINYVFGMGDKNVYMYNSSGVQAFFPIKNFVNPPLKR